MQVKLMFFSVLRDIVQAPEMIYEVTEGCSCEQLLDQLKVDYGAEDILKESYLAKNGIYAYRDTKLAEGDEVAIIPSAVAREI